MPLNSPDDGDPQGLILDSKGNIYGTTFDGGAYSDGSVFEITPAQLVFTTQPQNGPAGTLQPVTVAMEDSYGNIITSDDSQVTISLASSSGTLGGDVTETAINGVATFTSLSLQTAGRYTLEATDGSWSSTVSTSFIVA